MSRPRLVLGSGSPRRRELLYRLGLDADVRAPELDERWERGESPADIATRLAAEKGRALEEEGVVGDDELVLTADTIVALGDEALGKPAAPEEAVDMLLRLAGREHTVYTAISLAHAGRRETDVEATRVWIRSLDRTECRAYVATGEPLDKAGAYAIQGYGSALVERIEGDFFTVMGLPVRRFLDLLTRFGLRYAFGSLERM